MLRNLKKKTSELFHYKDNIQVLGANKKMEGNCSELRGNCSELRGNCSGLRGDCSWLRGDFDDCGITLEERINGLNIINLYEEGI
jgi:hypothetical protein